MSPRIKISQKYTQELLPFESGGKFVYLPYVDAILKNLQTGDIDQTTSKFLIDTGASISIINKRYESFIKNMKPIDTLPIRYGNNRPKKMPIYNLGIIIKGHIFEVPMAYDDEGSFLLLGQFNFLNFNTYNLFDSLLKKATLARI